MPRIPFYKGDVASLKSSPCNEFIDLERPERIFDHLVWFLLNTCNNISSLTEIKFLLVKAQSGILSARKDRAGLSFLLPRLLGVYLPTMEQAEGQGFTNSLLWAQLFVWKDLCTDKKLQTRDVAG